VEKKFGDNDYRDALTQLLELQQTDSLDTYIAEFEGLQYQIAMHNSNLGDLFFITQFMRGLKMEISSVVQTQVPETMERAILLAKIQQQVLERSKPKWNRFSAFSRLGHGGAKPESKGNSLVPQLWRERQTRDYRRANNLCYFCAEPYDATHKNVCTKRPQQQQPQSTALVVNSLDVNLTEDVLN
jgi:hypothetical protein